MNRLNDYPLVSIIVGIYNGEKYLSECLDSIIGQDYQNLEILLIDDGSKDSSNEIASRYAKKDNRITLIYQENMGVSYSRNRALDIAKGEYICIIDQDDILSFSYVSYLYNLIKKNKAQIALTPTADKFFEKPNFVMKKNDNVDVWSGDIAVKEMLYHKIIIAPWNKMISRSLLNDNNVRFNSKFFCGEGFAFSIQSYQYAERIAVGKQCVYHYRVGDPESGASKFRESTIYSSIEAQKFIKATLINPTPAILKAWKFSNWHTYCDCLNVMVGCDAINVNKHLYEKLKNKCQKDALCALVAPVSLQQKLRGILFKISPYMAAKIINHFRIRKFSQSNI